MSLKQWADNGWLKSHKTSMQEISNLFAIVDRDLNDAKLEGDLSDDWKFGIAYNAVLKVCTIIGVISLPGCKEFDPPNCKYVTHPTAKNLTQATAT